MKLSGKTIAAFLGLAIFLFILSRIDLAEVSKILSGLEPSYYALSLALLVALLFLKGVKWKLVLQSQGKDLPLLESVRLYLIGLFVSNVTPGKIGDFSKALYLKQKIGIPAGIASVLVDRAMDVCILVLFSMASVFWFASVYNVVVFPPSAILLIGLVFAAGIFLLIKEQYLKAILRPLFHFIVPKKYQSSVSLGFSGVYSSLREIKKRPLKLAASVLTGLCIWVLGGVVFYSLSLSLSLNAPFEIMLMIFPIISLADLVPISFSGLGTRDAVMIFLFSLFSLSAESAVALALIVFFTGYVLVSFAGFLFFLADPVKLDSIFG